MARYDIFLSYNSEDREAVRQIRAALTRKGLKCWIDVEALTPGRLWQEEAEEELRSSRAAAVFVGTAGIGPWENMEMRALLARVAQEGRRAVEIFERSLGPDHPRTQLGQSNLARLLAEIEARKPGPTDQGQGEAAPPGKGAPGGSGGVKPGVSTPGQRPPRSPKP